MKICILSMQRVSNFGSLLQSYALKELLESLGHTVHFIDIEPIESDNLLLSNCINSATTNTISQKICSKIQKIDKYLLNRIKNRARQKLQDELFEEFRVQELGVSDTDNNAHYDLCVIGSDEVFNCMTPSPWGFTSQLFGNVRQADRVVTYAASCGATKLEQLPKEVKERIKESFSRIDGFSVRDENTSEFVSALTDKSVLLHLDPVAIGDFSKGMAQVKNLAGKLPQRYCIIYSYYNRIDSKEEYDPIIKFCKQHNFEPVTIGAPQKWVKNHLVLDPFEVLVAFKNADFVITDTFHGTLFSARFANRFAVTTRISNQNKLGDLLTRLHLEKHQIRSFNELENVFLIKKDEKSINMLFARQKDLSMSYLMNQVSVEQ